MILRLKELEQKATRRQKVAGLEVRAADADVVICSSDNVRFHLHKRNLECTTQGFPPADTPTNGEVVVLSETAATLEILFQFIYPRRYPDLGELESDSLFLVAEAAEKYGVSAAMYGCQFALRKILASKPKDILNFAAKHDYPSLIVELPQDFKVNTPLSELVHVLPPHIYQPWSLLSRTLDRCPATRHETSARSFRMQPGENTAGVD
ncbi:hypothetical protein BT96DRAFT_1023542 [Gymnopus androsaceus JB14]|uniref:BTB domain-containing protein n=1 Tax=Gymnopus androsaceus JB14 TaxID=1447944 RepID=A0A6A4H345_9AGAR|nr:hypothetical protein BT96DRAFT_1023542 [Gymnopus androsaceus JB14]